MIVRWGLGELPGLILMAFALALLIKSTLLQAFWIPTGSMEPTLVPNDRVIVAKVPYYFHDPQRGDVIVFKYPEEPERDFIKRVIGLPGETLQVRQKRILINGKPLDEPYVHYLQPASTDTSEFTSADVRENYGPVTVPPNQFFVMGDNRDQSADSRVAAYRNGLDGPVPFENLGGRAEFITFSLDGTTKLWNPLSWFQALRGGRAGTSLHPDREAR